MSLAKKRFDDTISRCRDLVNLHLTQITNDDLLRAAVVFAISALDMFAIDRFMEEFVGYIRRFKVDDSVAKLLEKNGFTAQVAIGLIKGESERPMRLIRTLVERGYAKTSMQSFESIDGLYAIYKLGTLTKNAERRLNRKNLRLSIEKLIHRRHEIVHAADYNGKNQLQGVEAEDVLRRINDLAKFVDSMDAIICNKFKRKRCKRKAK